MTTWTLYHIIANLGIRREKLLHLSLEVTGENTPLQESALWPSA